MRFIEPSPVKLSIIRPRVIEVNKQIELQGVINTSWDNNLLSAEIEGQWILTNGTTVTGSTISWTPTFEDFTEKRTPTFVGYVKGLKESTLTSLQPKISILNYEFPVWSIKTETKTFQAPSLIRLSAIPSIPIREFLSVGGKVKYTWTTPSNTEGFRASGSSAFFTATLPGVYSVNVKIEDERGNAQELTADLTVVEPVPYQYDLRILPTTKVIREPATIGIRPMLSGGHPKEKIIDYKFLVNDQVVGENKRPFYSATLNGSGEFKVGFEAKTNFDRTVTGSKQITVAANQNPTCTLTVRGETTPVATANCKDVDGKIKSYQWKVNGQVVGVKGTRISGAKGSSIELIVTDDSGGSVTATGNL